MKHIFILFAIFLGVQGYAQNKMTRAEYIEKYKDVAIQDMRKHKVPASITLAQAVLESGNGNSELSQKSNNHFGIKCHSSWKGKKTYHDDDKKQECFRVYSTVLESYADHSDFLHKSRYAKCFELKITDYKGWARELKSAGYATNPKYPKLLIKIIEDYELYKYDKIALGKGYKEPKNTEETIVEEPKKKDKPNNDFTDIDYYAKPMVKVSDNNIKFVSASKGDTPEKIAKKLEMGPWQIKMYNNVASDYIFRAGEKVYLQPKRGKAKQPYHIVKSGESVWIISQRYGVKMSKIRRFNKLPKGATLKPGKKIYLRNH